MTRPPIFADMSFNAARDSLRATDRWLLVDATASWCAPCHAMDRTTWVDARVIEWVAGHGLAIQIDVDAEKEVAQQLGIRSMPTVIALQGESERDRIVGLQSPAQLLSWLDGLVRGETNAQRLRASASESDVQARMALARALRSSRKLDEATDEYVWLWQNMIRLEPAMVGVKHSFFISDIKQLVHEHSPARVRFTAIRDSIAPPPGQPPDVDSLRDWMSLNEALGDAERTLVWFDATSSALGTDEKVSHALELVVIPLLIARHRWADVGKLYRDPLRTLRKRIEIRDRTPTPNLPAGMEDQKEHLMAFIRQSFRSEIGKMVRGLRAAGRADEAEQVCAEALKADPSTEMETALKTPEPAPPA